MTVEALAPAKINLALHITGRRRDGYHLLDTLVAFGPVADRVSAERAERLSLMIGGPEAGGLDGEGENLVLKAARIVAGDSGARMTLEKHLPVSSGIGGGSSDAAATLRALGVLLDRDDEFAALNWNATDRQLHPVARGVLDLGADVPMCLLPQSLRARGIGERIDPVRLPPVACVLANPRVPVSTPDVFRALKERKNPGMPDRLPEFADAATLIDWLAEQRNDLQAAAIGIAPAIAAVLDELDDLPGAGLARMSGSGATCFALFANPAKAEAAEKLLRKKRPDWWIAGGLLANREEWWRPRVKVVPS